MNRHQPCNRGRDGITILSCFVGVMLTTRTSKPARCWTEWLNPWFPQRLRCARDEA